MKVIQVIPLLTVKFTLIPDKGFRNTERLYQAVIAQSVEPRHIFVFVWAGFESHTFTFFRVGDIF